MLTERLLPFLDQKVVMESLGIRPICCPGHFLKALEAVNRLGYNYRPLWFAGATEQPDENPGSSSFSPTQPVPGSSDGWDGVCRESGLTLAWSRPTDFSDGTDFASLFPKGNR